MYTVYCLANKPLMNSNQQTHQAMQGKYNNYQVSASQNNQMVNFIYITLMNNVRLISILSL